MKYVLTLILFGATVAISHSVEAAVKKTAPQKKSVTKNVKASKKATKGKLSTDVSFDDSVLRGEYQSPEEALAKVENEKGFGDLIGVRKHFKDRLPEAAEQE